MIVVKKQTETIDREYATSIVCDVCKKEYTYKGEEGMEAQEFHVIRFQGGYGSVFGDGTHMKLDMCQHCLKKILGEYLTEDTDNEM